MLTVAITGNAGTGKTAVAAIWREQGVEVIDADELAHEVVDSDRELRRKLAIEFGDAILEPSAGAETGALRREELARRAFASPERTRALNRLVHPRVMTLLEQRLAEARRRTAAAAAAADAGLVQEERGPERVAGGPTGRLVAVDAALIFEAGAERLFDRIVLVTAPAGMRIERMRRRGLPEAVIAGMIVGQVSDAEKLNRADYVIHNDSSLEALRAAALEVLASLLSSSDEASSRSQEPTAPAPKRRD